MKDFRLSAIFSDNMVLQQGKRTAVFGDAEDGTKISVRFLDKEVNTVASGGSFKLWLPAMRATDISEAGTEGVLKIGSDMIVTAELPDNPDGADEEKIIRKIFKNVVVGEVWLAGGQSNMEFELQNMTGGKEILEGIDVENAEYSNYVRFYYTQKKAFIDEDFLKSEAETGWDTFSADNSKCWSAAGFLYGRILAAKLGVIVGIVGCNWGGTSASAWIDRDAILSDESTAVYVTEYDEQVKGKSLEQQKKEYEEYEISIAEWDRAAAPIWEKDPHISWEDIQKLLGPNLYPGPMGAYNPFRPAGLYECMISRIMPYTLRGFIYYQGESDDHRPESYYRLFSILIKKWREYFEDDTLSFLAVQLPCHRYFADPDKKNWCIIREAQMQVFKDGLADGIAVAMDAGEFSEIHPKDKRAVADRLARQALYKVYNVMDEEEAFGPLLAGAEISDEAVVLHFDHAEEGFIIKNINASDNPVAHETDIINNDNIIGFEIAGEDMKFYPANVSCNIYNEEKREYIKTGSFDNGRMNDIILSSPDVKAPKAVRYLWTNYGTVSLFGKTTGIPAAPFNISV
ncbi:sialate O-acetylesterase [Eubacterium ruminantium]|nr:sialate O-acetylesterase [Eubacterium ruminantium]